MFVSFIDYGYLTAINNNDVDLLLFVCLMLSQYLILQIHQNKSSQFFRLFIIVLIVLMLLEKDLEH